ncbi:MAG: sugar-binding protein [Candidatus Ratteibacteria bacterium]
MKRSLRIQILSLFSLFLATISFSAEKPTEKASHCFLFGPADTSLRSDFIAIHPEDLWNEKNEYGWMKTGVTGTLRPSPDQLRKNAVENTFHEGKGKNTFRVSTQPGAYCFLLVSGDLTAPPSAFSLTVNGNQILTKEETEGLIPRISRWTREVHITENYLDFEFQGLPNYIVNALIIAKKDHWQKVQKTAESIEKEGILGPPEQLNIWRQRLRTEPNPFFTPTALQKKQGFALFTREHSVPIFSDTIPSREEINAPIESFAAQGETESLIIGLYPIEGPVMIESVSYTALKASSTQVISQKNLSLKILGYRYHRTAWTGSTEYENSPDLLSSFTSGLILNETKMILLEVNIPKTAAAGKYRGSILLRTNRGRVNIPITLTVLPFSLPEKPDRTFGMFYLSPEAYASTPAVRKIYEDRGLMENLKRWKENDFRDLAAHGVTALEEPFMFTIIPTQKNGKIEFRLSESFIDEAVKAGILSSYMISRGPDIRSLCNITGDKPYIPDQVKELPPPFSEKFNQLYIAGVQYLVDKAREKEWPPPIFFTVDEPYTLPRQDLSKRLARLIRQVPGAKSCITGILAPAYIDSEMAKLHDIIIYSGPANVPEDPALRKGQWFYPNEVTSSCGNSLLVRFYTGFGFWFSGLEGLAPWRYFSQIRSLTTDIDGRMTDFYMSFPGYNEHIPTLRWETWREGWNDCRYLTLLERKISEARKSGIPTACAIAEEAEEKLRTIQSRVPSLKEFATGTATVALGSGLSKEGSYNREEWIRQNCRRIRWVIASEIIRLNQALDGKKSARIAPLKMKKNDISAAPTVKKINPSIRKEKSLGCARASNIIVDGEFNEECWRFAKKVSLVLSSDGKTPRKKTEVMTADDGENLYIAFICFDSDMSTLRTMCKDRDDNVWNDDCVELFLGKETNCRDFYHFIVTAGNVVMDAFYPNGEFRKKWNAKNFQSAVKKFDTYWQAELKIDLSELNLAHTKFLGLNLCREEQTFKEKTCWTTQGTGFANSHEFGKLLLAGTSCYFGETSFSTPVFGQNNIPVIIANRTSETVAVSGTVVLTDAASNATRTTIKEIEIPPYGEKNASFAFTIDSPETFTAQILLFNKLNQLLDSYSFPIDARKAFIVKPSSFFLIRNRDLLTLACTAGINTDLLAQSTLTATIKKKDTEQIIFRKEIGMKKLSTDFTVSLRPAQLTYGTYTLSLTVTLPSGKNFSQDIDFSVISNYP